jgi:hypothetical protein
MMESKKHSFSLLSQNKTKNTNGALFIIWNQQAYMFLKSSQSKLVFINARAASKSHVFT